MSLDKLFPKRGSTWAIWFMLVVLVLPTYYLWFPYPKLSKYYEDKIWQKGCPGSWEPGFCRFKSSDKRFAFDVRAPAYVSDFMGSPLQIAVENIYSDTLDATVNLKLNNISSEQGRPIFTVDGRDQSSIVLKDMPPYGRFVTTFKVRMANGRDGEKYNLQVFLNNEEVEPIVINLTFDRAETFRLWMIEYLLSPPGANVVIPVGVLLLVSLAESVALLIAKARRQYGGNWWKIHRVLGIGLSLLLLLVSLASTGLMCYFWQGVAVVVVPAVLLSVFVGVAIGWWDYEQLVEAPSENAKCVCVSGRNGGVD